MKKNFLILILSMIFLIPGSVYAANFTINGYDIDMNVNSDNTFDITEGINVNFLVPQHGIYRNIPLRNNIIRTDGTKSKNRAEITNIQLNEYFTTSNSKGYKTLKIGDANKTVSGEHQYIIKYKYNIGKDPLKDKDELYFNLVGSEWESTISNVRFNITMPENIDSSKVGFSVGQLGTSNSSGVKYNVINNVIRGSYSGTINPGEALTVRASLPEGYFIDANSTSTFGDYFWIVIIVIALIFVIIADRLWAKYGKDKEIVETVEFYPPEGYNSAEVGYIYYGNTNNNRIITSLLLYLASKGYIKIQENEGTGLFANKKDYKICKVKEYDGDNECEKIFFNGLFSHEAQSVIQSELVNKFYVTVGEIKKKLESAKDTIFEKSSGSKVKWVVIMAIILMILITIKPVIDYFGTPFVLPHAILFPSIGLFLVVTSLAGKSKIPKGFGVVFGLLFGGLPWMAIILPALLQSSILDVIAYIIGFVSMLVLIFFAFVMPKRTVYGGEMFGKIKSFKKFIETAYIDEINDNNGFSSTISRKQKIQDLMEQDPQYFYNILPYAYAFGLEKEWSKQFESIALTPPDWYYGRDAFDMIYLDSFMHSIQSSMTTSYSDTSGGGFSGGGFSGGGSGRRWRRFLVKNNSIKN